MNVPLRRKVLFAIALYLVAGTALQACGSALGFGQVRYGRASPKPYLPFSLVPDREMTALGRLFGLLGARAVATNRLGYADEREFVAAKAQGTIRILCLGGSTTFIPHDQPYPRVLQHLLEERYRNLRPIEVWNASMIGYSVIEARAQLEEEFARLNVDIVLFSEQWNFQKAVGRAPGPPRWSSVDRAIGMLPGYNTLAKMRLDWVGKRSSRRAARMPVEDQVRAYMEQLEALSARVEAMGAVLVVGIHPDRLPDEVPDIEVATYALDGGRVTIYFPAERLRFKRALEHELRAFARWRGLPLIDWQSELHAEPRQMEELFQATARHVTAAGSALLAEIAAARIAEVIDARLPSGA